MKYLILGLSLLYLTACTNKTTDQNQEEQAIKKRIIAETEAWINRDSIAWLNCYAQLPNSEQSWNNRDGTWDATKGWDNIFKENIKDYRKNRTPRTDRLENTNWMIQLCGTDWAWVTFDQTVRRDRDREFKNHEFRVMSKIKGEWKLVGNSSMWDYSKTANIGDVLTAQMGKVVTHTSSNGSTDYIIETTLFNKTMTLYPIGLPDAFKKTNKPIKFDGELLYGKHTLYKQGTQNNLIPDTTINLVRIDAIK